MLLNKAFYFMTIECVSVENCHLFEGNPLAEQFRLRYKSLIVRQSWELAVKDDLEFDQYDNPAAVYFVWRDGHKVAGVSRLYPTTYPYMLKEIFPNLVTREPLPTDPTVWEGSRFCVDNDLPPRQRIRICQELVLAYLEYGVARGIENIIGVMLPAYWRNLFVKNGWDLIWLGDAMKDNEGKKIRAARLPVSQDVLNKVKETTGLSLPILSYGSKGCS